MEAIVWTFQTRPCHCIIEKRLRFIAAYLGPQNIRCGSDEPSCHRSLHIIITAALCTISCKLLDASGSSSASVVMITNEIHEQFDRDGAICLRGVFGGRWVEAVKRGIQQTMENPGPGHEKLRGQTGGTYFDDYCNWTRVLDFVEYVHHSPAAEIAGRLLRSKWAAFYHEHVLVKEPGAERETPWHHDQSYYPIDGFKVCSIWMPVDPVAEDVTIQFVAGSHRWGKWFFPRKFATLSNYARIEDHLDHAYEDVPVRDIDSGKHPIIKWAVQPGDCVVFHMRTLHGAPGNPSQTSSRRVLATRWLGDDAVLAKRPWEVSPPTMGGLQPGDIAVSDEFPIIWRAKD